MVRLFQLVLLLTLVLPAVAVAQDPATTESATEEPPAEEPAEIAEDEEAPDVVKIQQEVYWAPPGAGNDKWTWIKLKSGEWQRGEIKDLHDGTLTFDSDELDQFTYDWDKVRAVISGRPHTITTWERDTYTGFIVNRSGEIRVLDSEGALIATIDPDDVSSMIQGSPREWNFWSGSLGVGSTIRAGNSDQTDGSINATLNRRALTVRWDNTFSYNFATNKGEQTQDNLRFNSNVDRYISRNWFVTISQYEFYRDPFQNIAARHTPGAGVGYDQKHSTLDWQATAGLAWQYVGYVSVQAGEDETTSELAGHLGMDADWDITKDVELEVYYNINFPFPAPSRYTSNSSVQLSIDLFRALELDLTFNWDRQNRPREDVDGNLPKQDDYRFTTGLSWEF